MGISDHGLDTVFAHALYLLGYMAKLGRGSVLICQACEEVGFPAPIWHCDGSSAALGYASGRTRMADSQVSVNSLFTSLNASYSAFRRFAGSFASLVACLVNQLKLQAVVSSTCPTRFSRVLLDLAEV
ncbi:hypothetical protein Q6A51_22080 [Pseudomonas sp. KFB-139]|uniref:Uncharacterized protein n=1 Tax=Pseudomonas serbiensis TaxID=3064350 RepID=A0ABT9CVE2_9PSED|nr:hypothetical protein [Pseudomonas sp. KFB-138]MDO7929469.1 hypothetical protein [Pseudomonas sp. KFB-138]